LIKRKLCTIVFRHFILRVKTDIGGIIETFAVLQKTSLLTGGQVWYFGLKFGLADTYVCLDYYNVWLMRK